jgi:beta-glucosidase
MRARFEQSAIRLLKNMFRVGLFENPYLDVAETISTVGHPDFMEAGYRAQLKALVLLKNSNGVLPLSQEVKVYIPGRFIPASRNFFGREMPEQYAKSLKSALASRYFYLTDNPAEADVAIVVIVNLQNGRAAGYSMEDAEKGGNGFLPITSQYGPYTSTEARETSLAGDAREGDVLNRTYKGKTLEARNSADLELVMKTVKAMKGKPVVVVLKMSNPTVVSKIEKEVQGLLINFNVQDQAVLDIISGKAEPSGLLPLQMPADMAKLERRMEDVPFDIEVHVEGNGNIYISALCLTGRA